MLFKSALISASELQDVLIQNGNVILLDCTIDKVGQSLKDAKLELLPNSLFFDIEGKFSDHASKLPHTLVSEQVFEKEVQALGIDQNSTVVLYDRWGIYSSPRAWWMFKVMGFDQVYILNGGVPVWKKNKYKLADSYKQQDKGGNFKAHFQKNLYADKDYILAHYRAANVAIFDARSKGRFSGLVPEPRKGLNGGHIPHSKNLPFEELLKDIYYKPTDELKQQFDQFKTTGNEYIFSCGSGVTASILAFASYISGHTNIRVYDGSWSEWGREELNLPIEK
ncbi:sulfurtransferase [Sphingobacterium sp. DR205]|uniref:sulfurtransferase n=1 Tax=Sphingobacterium sp. DR205 TaxID=2713573 RepID=UPI0013E4424F|nr:sulfurtransferase [Sphingobacterium sp. DR205]QIH35754.1 sulfurtransferase [Sphingobacterium sp. DR205]